MAHYLALIALSLCGNLFKWKWIKINLGGELPLIEVPESALAAGCLGSRSQVGTHMKGRLDWFVCMKGEPLDIRQVSGLKVIKHLMGFYSRVTVNHQD